ncbi:cytochrome P460 family protein [Bosea sp. TAF32]|uniref:cytochrome P460 family protein n=1 Tax=Bosea sp. TAF32 TaxID=3237482 RepID=UPI003F914001
MSPIKLAALPAALVLFAGIVSFRQAHADSEMVRFPSDYAKGIHYATVNRGNIREELFVSPEAVEAVKAGRPMPSGTVITMEDHRDGELYRYVVMEKRTGWGSRHAPEIRTSDWEFQWFNPDRSQKAGENLDRCRSCHVGQAANDFVFTADRIKAAK